MLLQSGVVFTAAQCHRLAPRRSRPICSAVDDERPSNDQLRAQLDQLRTEAEVARTKANTTRTRLLRLTEAAENLRKQATVSITKGKENDARELLFQKKKIMQALEKSKKRIELLDELSIKLHEAISIKESQLIGNVTINLQVGMSDMFPQVRIVSPKQDITDILPKDERLFHTEIEENDKKTLLEAPPDRDATTYFSEDLNDKRTLLESPPHRDATTYFSEDLNHIRKPANPRQDIENEMVGDIIGTSFFEELMINIDEQLKKIEDELATILKVSSSKVHDSPRNIQMQQMMELLDDITSIRKRVLGAMQQHVQP